MDFKIIYYRHNKYQKVTYMNPSRINFYDLTILFYGKMQYIIDGKTINLKSGDIIFIPVGSLRERMATNSKVDFVSFNIESTETFCLPLHIEDALGKNEISLLISVYDEINSQSIDSQKRLNLLLQCIILQIQENLRAKELHPIIDKIKAFVEQNYTKKISLKDISKFTHYSEIYLNNIFKKQTGSSIINYLIDKRITQAKMMIIENTHSLKAISESVGFDDYNYFSRLFKSRVGYSPSQYKNVITNR